MITFGSVCSGLEAASVAWGSMGWSAAWLAEIEPAPAKMLHHHYGSGRPLHMPNPDEDGVTQKVRNARRAAIRSVAKLPATTSGPPNLGDFTRIAGMIRAGLVAAPDVLCGGTPCQAFSIAGLRNSLDDARGNLSLTFCKLADDIDTRRATEGKPPCTAFWENVPGVLNTKDNAFGCFLAGLAGEDDPLVAPGGKWPNAGCVFGPKRTVSWRVLDAQYFGVAQRRRRVFVVASARAGFDPVSVLFESDGVRRDTAPRRETREEIAGSLTSSLGRRNGTPDCGSTPGQLVTAFGGNNQSGPIDVATARNACSSSSGRLDFESETFVVTAFDSRQECVSSTEVFGAQAQAVCFSGKDYGADALTELAPTMRAMNSTGSHPNGGGQLAVCVTGAVTHCLKGEGFDASEDGTGRGQPIVAFQTRGSNLDVGVVSGTIGTNCDRASGGAPMAQYGTAVRRLTPMECERLQGFPDGYTATTGMADGPRYKALGNSWAVPVVEWIGRRINAQLWYLAMMPKSAQEWAELRQLMDLEDYFT